MSHNFHPYQPSSHYACPKVVIVYHWPHTSIIARYSNYLINPPINTGQLYYSNRVLAIDLFIAQSNAALFTFPPVMDMLLDEFSDRQKTTRI